jgi:hypothetical protein
MKRSMSIGIIMDEYPDLTVAEIEGAFDLVIGNIENEEYASKLEQMFRFAIGNEVSLFPTIKVEEDLEPIEKITEYLISWCGRYIANRENLAINSPIKNYGERDDALTNRVLTATDVDEETLEEYITGHFLFMSVENRNGDILEEYLAHVLEPIGWIWCAGATYRAIDFCYLGEEPILLQIKNKYNTENSSSSHIRSGTNIQKWYRLKQPRVATGLERPLPNWEALHRIVFDDRVSELLSETEYLNYISENSTNEIDQL